MRKLSGYGPSLIVLATAALVLFVGPRAVQQLTYEHTKTKIVQARHNLEQSTLLEKLNNAYSDIATLVEPSVVHVSAQYLEKMQFGPDRPGLSTGSGWIFDDQGHIVTNHHVIQNALRIDVQLYNGEIRPAQIIGSDPTTDVAVIKITPGRLHPATIADLDQMVNQGDLVFAFGSPFDFRFSMSSGVVSGKDRSVGVIRDEAGRRLGYENFIQVDAAINPGNSGGPLTDYRGRVIGMNTAIATGRRASGAIDEGQFAGIGLAIPMDMITPVVTQLIETGEVAKGFMGVEPVELEPNIAQQLGFIGQGVFIRGVEPDGPASQGGVRAHDIITHVRGKAIGTVQQLRSLVSSARPGETVRLTVWRYDLGTGSGETVFVDVNLSRLEDTLARGPGPIGLPRSRFGIPMLGLDRLITNTPELAAQLGHDEFRPGVVIAELAPESSLSIAGIEAGSVIVDVMDRPVSSVDELFEILEGYAPPARIGIRATIFTPSGERKTLTLRAE